MSSMEHSNSNRSWDHRIAPEYVWLVLLAVFAVGLALAWPW
jgi:hypothetical protein